MKSSGEPGFVSRRSMWGINAANFFLAEIVSLFLPFLSAFLKGRHWSYEGIGLANALSGSGSLVFQIPAGMISDRVRRRRGLLGASSLALGLIFLGFPFIADQASRVYLLLFLFGVVGTFLNPLLSALALSLVGRNHLDIMIGINQAWNHLGGVAGALASVLLVDFFGVESIFYFIALGALFAALALLLIRGNELNPDLEREMKGPMTGSRANARKGLSDFLRNAGVRSLVAAVALFQVANAPLKPFVGLYLKSLGGSDALVAWVIFVSTAAMIPSAWIAGRACASHGRKLVLGIGFLFLPVHILLCCLTRDPVLLVIFQLVNGISTGIYGVVIVLVCGDLTRGKKGFNTLLGLMQTSIALGGFVGPLIQGHVTNRFGFIPAFLTLMTISILAALLFLFGAPETGKSASENHAPP